MIYQNCDGRHVFSFGEKADDVAERFSYNYEPIDIQGDEVEFDYVYKNRNEVEFD